MKLFIGLILLTLPFGQIWSQSDTLFQSLASEFDEFIESSENELNDFNIQNDSAFLKFLEESWKEFEVYKGIVPVKQKPEEQPELKQNFESIQDTNSAIVPNVKPNASNAPKNVNPNNNTELKFNNPEIYESQAVLKTINVFGIPAEIQYYPNKIPSINSIDEKSITEFYRHFSNNRFTWGYNIKALTQIKNNYNFNDWGWYSILKQAAKSIYVKPNEQILFVWYALLKSGYHAKVGYDKSNVFLLLPSQQELYSIPYISENSLKYYLFPAPTSLNGQLKTYSGLFNTNSRIISLRINKLPETPLADLEFRKVMYLENEVGFEFNKINIDFLASYPQCVLQTYFDLPISESNSKALDNFLIPLIKEKPDREKIDILLSFVQGAIAYKTDQEQFGKERYMFAEESLYYPYADCEDRTVLLRHLIKQYIGLPSVGLEYENHITLAVHIPGETIGDYVLYKGKKYFICDPTYMNAKSGQLPEALKNEKPTVIDF